MTIKRLKEERKKAFEVVFKRTLKYRTDFLPENYNKFLQCWYCNKEKRLMFFPYRKGRSENKDKICKQCKAEEHRQRRLHHSKDQIITSLLTNMKSSIKKKINKCRSEFKESSLTKDDVYDVLNKQNDRCAYTNRILAFEYNNINKISIDRIDSSRGYVKENIQLVCWCANQAKNNLDENEFLSMVDDIYKYKSNY